MRDQLLSLATELFAWSSHRDKYVISTVPILVYNSDLNPKPWDKPANDHRLLCSFPLRGSPFHFLRHGLLCYGTSLSFLPDYNLTSYP